MEMSLPDYTGTRSIIMLSSGKKIGNCLFGFDGRREKKWYICVMNKGKCVRYR